MYLGKRYIASAAVEYRIEVRLTDCAIRRSQSILSSLLSSRRFLVSGGSLSTLRMAALSDAWLA